MSFVMAGFALLNNCNRVRIEHDVFVLLPVLGLEDEHIGTALLQLILHQRVMAGKEERLLGEIRLEHGFMDGRLRLDLAGVRLAGRPEALTFIRAASAVQAHTLRFFRHKINYLHKPEPNMPDW